MNNKRKATMRKDTEATVVEEDCLGYGPDTSGFNADNASDFIRRRAYQLFEMRGREPGHLRAEQEIRTRLQI